MAQDLVAAKRRYERHLRQMNTTCDVVKAFTAQTDNSTVSIYREECEQAWTSFYGAYEQLEPLLNEDHIQTYQSEFAAIHEKFITVRILLDKYSAPETFNSTTFQHNNSCCGPDGKLPYKMPPIKIRPFNGNLDDWSEFKATCTLVLTDRFPEIQRLQSLKEALVGEPRELVKHVAPEFGSYDTAWQILETRYDNKRSIVNASLKRFFDLPSLKYESADALNIMKNTTSNMLAVLKGFNIDTTHWDCIVVYILACKLDPDGQGHWEESLKGTKTIPALKTFYEHLETRINILHNTGILRTNSRLSTHKLIPVHSPKEKNDSAHTMLTLNANFKCFLCEANHIVARCQTLLSANSEGRAKLIDDKKLCRNCLNRHLTTDCPYTPNCKHCEGGHHTLLHKKEHATTVNHLDSTNEKGESMPKEHEINTDDEIEHCFHTQISTKAILATALVPISYRGKTITVRALIDQGSTGNLITNRLCQTLGLPLTDTYIPLTGPLDVKVGQVDHKTTFTIGSNHDKNFSLTILAYVVKTVTGLKPVNIVEANLWPHLNGLPLADPDYLTFSHIDLLLGSIAHGIIIQGGLIKGSIDEPIAQDTSLGWIISGAANKIVDEEIQCNVMFEDISLNKQLQAFWELEEIDTKCGFTSTEEETAREIFAKTICRDSNGQLMVDLPFKMNPHDFNCFGDSYSIALRRYISVQKRLAQKPEFKRTYNECIQEYLTLGHMELATSADVPFVCLPHHPVVKETSSTTKIRPVMDASAKTTNGFSLNDRLCVGPTIQPDLFELLIQWRRFEYAFSGDIEKMYRQVRINPQHAKFQCILHQLPGESEIKRFKLLTVTFGTASAPYQAIAALNHVGEEIKSQKPHIAENIQKHFYVDDFLGCEKSITDAKRVREELTEVLAQYGFKIRKWKSSNNEILADISDNEKEKLLDFESTVKTLGIAWQPSTDTFIFKSNRMISNNNWTKRKVLSEISKLFDPLGWMAPFVIKSKILMQQIWQHQNCTDWDSPLPSDLLEQWCKILEQVQSPISAQIPRWLGLSDSVIRTELHCFADASMSAYCAAIYLRCINENGTITCNIVAAKTKVAPTRPLITIPRLELCAAVLATKLYEKVNKSIAIKINQIYAWSDSKICLAWIAAEPMKWSVFVSHRVSKIQKILPIVHWAHITSDKNPADLGTRGLLLSELSVSQLWWQGPSFLTQSGSDWHTPTEFLNEQTLPEHRKTVHIQMMHAEQNHVLETISDFNHLLRFTIRAKRWLNRSRDKIQPLNIPITAKEMDCAETQWVKIVQFEKFAAELTALKNHGSVATKSSLVTLNPFIDGNDVCHMNGRVRNEELWAQSTAIILPAHHRFTQILIREYHNYNALHGGVQLTLRALRDKYWIIHGRNAVKRVIGKCLTCFRFNKHLLKQKMGNLPLIRTQSAKPFAFVGCDFAGPFSLKVSERRNTAFKKGYIALFLCLTTTAIHLEVAGSLSSDEFVMVFEDFIARRGIPVEFHSDNGTNFIGAKREIDELYDQLFNQNNEIAMLFARKRITFKNIPARASHMGGIWERSVGLVKSHLYRVMGDVRLTEKRFGHVLIQIEAAVNSRPLWSLTADGNDAQVLTPSHFYNFEAINTLPKPDISHLPLNRLDQYQYLYRLYLDFWKLWSREYICKLQPRSKWTSTHPNVMVGQAVIIADDAVPPSRWKLGTITATYPGKDGLVRVADVRTACLREGTGKKKNTGENLEVTYSILKRPIHKLGLLPIIDNELDRLPPINPGQHVE